MISSRVSPQRVYRTSPQRTYRASPQRTYYRASPQKNGTEISTTSTPAWCTNGKKFLLLFVFVQAVVIVLMQWKFGNILQLVYWDSTASPITDNPATNFLGVPIDVHKEHAEIGHTWEEEHSVDPSINPIDIAVGLAITSHKLYKKKPTTKWPFFTQLMPSFCKTATKGYNYHFFLAFDYVDKFFTHQQNLESFVGQFREYTEKHCPKAGNSYSIHFVQCSHTGKPANAQNDAMLAAYMLNMAYYYRINDDTVMSTGTWTEKFIDVLHAYTPSNVGVVGPNHKNGNTAILTYDFVHHSHVTVFGSYYPHVFTDWWGDSWISDVYKPGRVTKLKSIGLVHTLAIGQRYVVHQKAKTHLKEETNHGKDLITRYVTALQRNKDQKLKPSPQKVIAMTLYGNDPKYTWGAIRNAQLMPVIFPNWTLHIYIDKSSNMYSSMETIIPTTLLPTDTRFIAYNASIGDFENNTVSSNVSSSGNGSDSNITKHELNQEFKRTKYTVPLLVLNKLQTLGAKIVPVDAMDTMAPKLWRHLVLDNKNVTHVLIRDARGRISERDHYLVYNTFLESSNYTLMYTQETDTTKDQNPRPKLDGQLSINRKHLNLKTSVSQYASTKYNNKKTKVTENDFLNDVLEPLTSQNQICYNGVTCQDSDCQPFPVKAKRKGDFFGQVYDIYDVGELKPAANNNESCYSKDAPVL